jgi:hypothetical protein
MKKAVLLTMFSLFQLALSAQDLFLKREWPSPRCGDVVEVSIQKKDSTGRPTELGEFKIADVTLDTGWVSIGPLTVQINGKSYHSDSMRIHVLDSLPAVREGFWSRFETINEVQYLITEQRVNPGDYPGSEEDLYTTIDCSMIKEKGFRMFKNSWQRTQKSVNIGGENTFIRYQITMYTIETAKAFDGKCVLGREYFMDWPEQLKFEEIVIRDQQ